VRGVVLLAAQRQQTAQLFALPAALLSFCRYHLMVQNFRVAHGEIKFTIYSMRGCSLLISPLGFESSLKEWRASAEEVQGR
jgi:hypothetical protein